MCGWWDSGMGSWEQPRVTTLYCNLLSAVTACGTVQTWPWGVYPLNQTQIIEVRHKIPRESPNQMETIHFTWDVAATFSCTDYFPLEELLAQAFNWKEAIESRQRAPLQEVQSECNKVNQAQGRCSGSPRGWRQAVVLGAARPGLVVPPLGNSCITEWLVFICRAQKAFHTHLLPCPEPALVAVPGFTLHGLCFTQGRRRKLSYASAVFACLSHLDCKLFMGLAMFMYRRRVSQSDMCWIIPDHKFWQTCWHTFKIIIINIPQTETSGTQGLTTAFPSAPEVFTETVTH